MKIEDLLEVLENSLDEAEAAMKNPKFSDKERIEARGNAKAYAHCIGLVKAVLEKKGWA